MPELFIQCELIQNDASLITWIPEKFAKKNTTLTLEGQSGIWKITTVFSNVKRTKEELAALRQTASLISRSFTK